MFHAFTQPLGTSSGAAAPMVRSSSSLSVTRPSRGCRSRATLKPLPSAWAQATPTGCHSPFLFPRSLTQYAMCVGRWPSSWLSSILLYSDMIITMNSPSLDQCGQVQARSKLRSRGKASGPTKPVTPLPPLLGIVARTCYRDLMRAFICEVDHHGLQRFLPERLLPADELARLARGPSSVVWALLDEAAAEALREDIRAGRHREACGLLLNRAFELVPLGVAAPESTLPTSSLSRTSAFIRSG